MPAQLHVHFTETSPAETAHIILMDSQLTAVNASDEAQAEALAEIAKNAGFAGKAKEALAVHGTGQPVLLCGIGEEAPEGLDAEKWGGRLYQHLRTAKFSSATLNTSSLSQDRVTSLCAGAVMASYHFPHYRTVSKSESADIDLHLIVSDSTVAEAEWQNAMGLIDGVFMGRDLVFEPANILYPESFAKRCAEMSSLGLEIEVLNEDRLEELGMGALLGVGQGSSRSSAIVVMRWNGGGDDAPLAFVGKGVCFDTGGISLKPAKGMEDMKWDMGGSAAVTGAMCAIAKRKLKRNIVGIIGLVENMPDGNAQRPGDVVTSMSGQTIEVINTDAEGRLVLADVLTYVQSEYKPSAIIDLATLTGAILVSLGKEYAGLFSNDDALANAVMASGEATDEKSWRMPLGDAYDQMLKSHIADMKNIGGPYGGSITAACFLQRFIENDTPWVHLDIAGKAWSEKAHDFAPKGGTGFGVRLLNHLADTYQP